MSDEQQQPKLRPQTELHDEVWTAMTHGKITPFERAVLAALENLHRRLDVLEEKIADGNRHTRNFLLWRKAFPLKNAEGKGK